MEDLNDILKLSGLKSNARVKLSEDAKEEKKPLDYGDYIDNMVKSDDDDDEDVKEAYTNEPDETYASVDAILRQGTDLNRPKSQHAVAGFTGDNPMTEGGADVDEDAVRELKIYIDHNADLYSQNVEPIQRNLSRKWDKGIYDHELAQKLFYYLAVNGAKQYGQEHSTGDGLRIFSPDVRKAVAKELADDWLAELKAGNKMEEAEEDLEAMLADILIREEGDYKGSTKKPQPNPAAGYGDETGGPGSDYINPEFAKQMAQDEENKLEIQRLYNKFPDKNLRDVSN